ncbi:hypothetical protein TMRH483_01363 [Qipengyuania sp. 483]
MGFNAFLTIGFRTNVQHPELGQLSPTDLRGGWHGTGDCAAGAAGLTAAA